MSKLVLDKIDYGILELLLRDARTPYTEVARKLGVSDATVHVRIKKLQEAGVVKKYTVILDPEKLGFHLAFVEVNVKPGSHDKVVEKLTNIEGVVEIHEIHGHCDILLKVRVKSLGELRDKIVKEIRTIPAVAASEAMTVLKVCKEEAAVAMLQELKA